MGKKIKLLCLDAVVIFFMGVFTSLLIYGAIRTIDPIIILYTTLCYLFCLALSKFYRHRIADSSLEMVKSSIYAFAACGVFIFLFIGYLHGFATTLCRWSLIHCVFSFASVLGSRMLYRLFQESKHENSDGQKTIIIGAGDLGSTIARMCRKHSLDYNIKGFLDDKDGLQDEIVLDYPVLGKLDDLEKILSQISIDLVIIAITKISSEKIQQLVSIAAKHSVAVKIVPNLFESKGRADVSIRDIDYADLLGRDLNTIEKEPLFELFSQKTILVTGAGGSIGSEICSQLLEYGLKRLILLDIDETELHDHCLRLLNYEHEWSDQIVPVVCDIKNKAKIEQIFNQYKPDIVFHAAAYKHVPLMELYPEEAILTNICGSFNVFDSARNNNVQKVVVISTDKAVNPTNVMGATKRVVEMMASSFASESPNTEFCCVRFGNVIGSRGSMLPLFLEEIKAGKPITVTDRNIIRFFMAIPEAVSLVFRAATLAKTGEVMVLDMGEPVKIYDFAQKLIDIFGDGRSSIKITGLRLGEKLYEELLADKDTTIPTTEKKVFKAKVKKTSGFDLKTIGQFTDSLKTKTTEELVKTLHETVPEFANKPQKQ